MIINGFKAFNSNCTNRYGTKFTVNKIYSVTGKIIWGNNGNGFHMCSNIEDTFRYFDAINEEIKIAQVIGFGKSILYDDEYYGYYDMYVCEKLLILKFLKREEIIKYLYSLLQSKSINRDKITRFINGFKLNEDEITHILNILYIKDFYNIEIYKKALIKAYTHN